MRWLRWRRRAEPDLSDIDGIIDRNVALASGLGAETRVQHRQLTSDLIAAKRWEPVGGIDLDAEVLVTIAANAAIPVLGLGLGVYRNVQSIIVRPTRNVSRARRAGPVRGVVSDHPTTIIGEASPHTGPMSIAWDAALADSRGPESGRNVVIHEFAHKIDMSDGYSDGIPPVRGPRLDRWTSILADEYERSEARESDVALRPYAWASRAEFFAVATEAFFCTPEILEREKPELHRALVDFYRPRDR